jgi:hypothetical protein
MIEIAGGILIALLVLALLPIILPMAFGLILIAIVLVVVGLAGFLVWTFPQETLGIFLVFFGLFVFGVIYQVLTRRRTGASSHNGPWV